MNFLSGCVFSIEPDLYLAQTDTAHARYEHFFFSFFLLDAFIHLFISSFFVFM